MVTRSANPLRQYQPAMVALATLVSASCLVNPWLVDSSCRASTGTQSTTRDTTRNADDATQEFAVQMRDGTILSVLVDDVSLEWNTVAQDGNITHRRIPLSDVKSLEMAVSPASKQVAEIRRMVNQLAADSYQERHAAEEKLLAEGKPFLTIIKQARQHAEPEVRYRVARIVKELGKDRRSNEIKAAIEFDKLVLSNGEELEGDVVDWILKCQWHGNELALSREEMFSVQRGTPASLIAETPPAGGPISVKSLIEDSIFFNAGGVLNPGLVQADFEKGPQGEDMVTDKQRGIDDVFSFLGCRMKCETNAGRVIISGFRFKQSRSTNNSIGNLFVNPDSGKEIRYQGVMRIDFCLPERSSIPATVKQVGMFLEIVLPKHTIIEAFNSAGHILGVTQTGRNRNSFIGFDSNTPIAYVRVRANEYLNHDKLNRDFAVDDLCFSAPVVAPDINATSHFVIVTNRGERVLAQSLQLAENTVYLRNLTHGKEELPLPLDQVRWIVGPAGVRSMKHDQGLFVMTDDGSVVLCHWNSGIPLALAVADQVKIDPIQICGLWPAGATARYPLASDFELGNAVIVRPINRVALQTVSLNPVDAAIQISLTDAVNLEQGMFEDDSMVLKSPATAESLGLDAMESELDLADDVDASVWFRPPTQRKTKTGLLRTYDGQQFVLGGELGFELEKIGQDEVVISYDNSTFRFELSDIQAFELPEKQ